MKLMYLLLVAGSSVLVAGANLLVGNSIIGLFCIVSGFVTLMVVSRED